MNASGSCAKQTNIDATDEVIRPCIKTAHMPYLFGMVAYQIRITSNLRKDKKEKKGARSLINLPRKNTEKYLHKRSDFIVVWGRLDPGTELSAKVLADSWGRFDPGIELSAKNYADSSG